MAVTPDGFAAMATRLASLAGGRAVYVLEGGYKPAAVARCVAAVTASCLCICVGMVVCVARTASRGLAVDRRAWRHAAR